MIKSQDSLSISIEKRILGLLDNNAVILKKWSITVAKKNYFFHRDSKCSKIKIIADLMDLIGDQGTSLRKGIWFNAK